MALLVVAAGFMGGAVSRRPSAAKVIVAKQLIFVDDTGNKRGIIGVDRDGRPGLEFYNKNGKTRISLYIGPSGEPYLVFADKKYDKPRIELGITSDGGVGLMLYDKDRKLRVELSTFPEGQPGLTFFDKNGKPRVGLAIGADGERYLGFFDKNGKPRAALGVSPEGQPCLKFANRNGKPIWSAP